MGSPVFALLYYYSITYLKRASCLIPYLIGTWVGDIDDTGRQLCLQIVDKRGLQSLSLVEDIFLISSTWQSKEETEVTVSLQREEEQALTDPLLVEWKWFSVAQTEEKDAYRHSSGYTVQLWSL